MPLTLHGVSHADHTASLNRKSHLLKDLGSQHKLAGRQKFYTNVREAGGEGDMLRRLHYIYNQHQKMKNNMLFLPTVPAVL